MVAQGLTHKVLGSEVGKEVSGNRKQRLGKAEQHHRCLHCRLYDEAEDGVQRAGLCWVVHREGEVTKGSKIKRQFSPLCLLLATFIFIPLLRDSCG